MPSRSHVEDALDLVRVDVVACFQEHLLGHCREVERLTVLAVEHLRRIVEFFDVAAHCFVAHRLAVLIKRQAEVLREHGAYLRVLEHIGARVGGGSEHPAVDRRACDGVLRSAGDEALGVELLLPLDERDRRLQVLERLARIGHHPGCVHVDAHGTAVLDALHHHGGEFVVTDLRHALHTALADDVAALLHPVQGTLRSTLCTDADVDAPGFSHRFEAVHSAFIETRVSAPAERKSRKGLRESLAAPLVHREVVVGEPDEVNVVGGDEPRHFITEVKGCTNAPVAFALRSAVTERASVRTSPGRNGGEAALHLEVRC